MCVKYSADVTNVKVCGWKVSVQRGVGIGFPPVTMRSVGCSPWLHSSAKFSGKWRKSWTWAGPCGSMVAVTRKSLWDYLKNLHVWQLRGAFPLGVDLWWVAGGGPVGRALKLLFGLKLRPTASGGVVATKICLGFQNWRPFCNNLVFSILILLFFIHRYDYL